MPAISVIIPCYNEAQYLDECLNSVLAQTYGDWEAVVINDGSTDKTGELAQKWVEKDTRFKYISTENLGVSHARNTGLQMAMGNFIQFLDADDLLSPTNFAKKMALSDKNQIILSDFNIYKNQTFLPGYNKLRKEYVEFETLLYGWEFKFTIPIHAALISRDLLNDFSFDTTLLCFEDWLMWLHVTAKKPSVAFVDEILVSYRKENNTETASSDLKKVLSEKMKVLPLLKKLYGAEKHDNYIYHCLEIRSLENVLLKKELKKVMDERVVSRYLKLKQYYYKTLNK
ncbi:MAG: glycosyltransferase family 2 protein [Kaistella sp.]